MAGNPLHLSLAQRLGTKIITFTVAGNPLHLSLAHRLGARLRQEARGQGRHRATGRLAGLEGQGGQGKQGGWGGARAEGLQN